MASVDRSDIVNMGGNLLNTNLEMDNGDDIEMETDDEDLRSLVKDDDNKSVNDEAEEGELVDCKDEGLDGDPVFDEHRPLSRPDFPLSEPGKPFLKKLIMEENVFNPAKTTFENRSGGFVTGVDIFSAEEQEKLTKRAQRFDINPSEARTLTQRLLKSLYKSMGVTPGDQNVRFDTLHMRGTEEMNTQDVFVYFKDYAPASIEWLNTSSCNVMWLDEVSAARALLGLSVRIKSLKSKESSIKRRKTIDNNSVEDATMDEDEEESDKDSGAENEESDAVSISDISVPIPPGLWRKGVTHPRSKCIFLRFATLEDRRTQRVGRANSQDFEGYIGLISESKKRRLQEQLGGIVFYDTGDEVFDKKVVPEEADNPWSAIAYSWGAFDRNRNKIRHDSPPKRPTPPPSPVYMSRYDRPLLRPELWDTKKRKYTDLDAGHSSGSEDWVKRRKLPRMRMHADDEVMLVEKRLRHGSKRHSEKRSDLRTRLEDREMIIIKKEKSSSSKDSSEEEVENEIVQPEDEEVPDLRVAVVTDRSPSPEDNKEDVWRSGQVKSVLRGARAHDTHSNHRSDSGDDDRRVRSSVRKHRSRSRERHHRSRRRKESSRRHHSRSSGVVFYSERDTDRRRGSSRQYEEYDSDEVAVQPNAQDLRAKISKKKKRDHDRDRHHRTRSHKDHVSDRRRRSDSHERRRSSSKDRDTTFRPKSPLQIEIDNDEYYKLIESD